MLAYFFGPRVPTLAACPADGAGIDPAAFACVIRCGVGSLKEGRWPITGRVPEFDPSQWPVPAINRGIRRDGQQMVAVLDEIDLLTVVEVRPAREGEWMIEDILDDSASPEWSVAKRIP